MGNSSFCLGGLGFKSRPGNRPSEEFFPSPSIQTPVQYPKLFCDLFIPCLYNSLFTNNYCTTWHCIAQAIDSRQLIDHKINKTFVKEEKWLLFVDIDCVLSISSVKIFSQRGRGIGVKWWCMWSFVFCTTQQRLGKLTQLFLTILCANWPGILNIFGM